MADEVNETTGNNGNETPQDNQEVSRPKTLVGGEMQPDETLGNDTAEKQEKTENTENPENQEDTKKPESDDEAKDDEEEAEGAPEEYEEFTFSEGFEAAPELLEEFTTLAKEDNLPQKKAQRYTEMGEKVAKRAYNDAYAQQVKNWDVQQEKWRDEILNDPEIGKGDPQRMETELAGCNAVLNQFADKDFREELATQGFGNNAGLVRMLHRINKATQSDKFIKGDAIKPKESPADIWYKD